MVDAGIEHVTFHGLRHSHSLHLIDSNVHMKVISERLGHSSISITMDLYGHLLKGAQNEAARKTDESLRKAMESND